VREALAADDAYVIAAGDPYFARVGDAGNPEQYEIKQRGYWVVWRQLASDETVAAASFVVENRLVMTGAALDGDATGTHLATILPGDESNSEMLVVRGTWPDGIGAERRDFLEGVRPILGCLVANVLDAGRQARHKEQLAALSDVARAFNDASEVDNVVEAVATALAKASGFDWVTINLMDAALTRVLERATNAARHSNTETAAMATAFTDGVLQRAREIRRTRAPSLIPDVFDPASELPAELQAYYQRAHILSASTFPMFFQDQILGTINFSSSTPRPFDADEVNFLAGLASQAATTLKGLQLYQELEEASRIQHFLARTDALTGIPNRRYIEEVLRAECARALRYDEPVSVVMADMDHFKMINDTFGHDAGDEALRHVANVARQSCRDADFVGRWGGDEFLFILPVTGSDGGAAFAERFRTGLSRSRFAIRGSEQTWPMTVSAGVAYGGDGAAADPDSLFQLADSALYEAKESGRDRIVVARRRAAAA
jgi:diguanylate cyclase (GGDEF)-like protein